MRNDGVEMLSVVDHHGRPLAAESREVVHRDGLWHESFHCLLVRPGPEPTALLQRRRQTARAFPDLLDLTVTGHLRAGERPRDGVREIREEIGIDVSPERLVSLGRRLIVDDSAEGRNREVAHVFLLVEPRPLEHFPLADADIGGLVEVTLEGLFAALAPGRPAVPAREVRPDGSTCEIEVALDQLVPQLDGYWTVLAIMAQRHLAGLRPLAI